MEHVSFSNWVLKRIFKNIFSQLNRALGPPSSPPLSFSSMRMTVNGLFYLPLLFHEPYCEKTIRTERERERERGGGGGGGSLVRRSTAVRREGIISMFRQCGPSASQTPPLAIKKYCQSLTARARPRPHSNNHRGGDDP